MLAVITSDRTQVNADALASDERPCCGMSQLHAAGERGGGEEKAFPHAWTHTRCSHTMNLALKRHFCYCHLIQSVCDIAWESGTHVIHLYKSAFTHIPYKRYWDVCISCCSGFSFKKYTVRCMLQFKHERNQWFICNSPLEMSYASALILVKRKVWRFFFSSSHGKNKTETDLILLRRDVSRPKPDVSCVSVT